MTRFAITVRDLAHTRSGDKGANANIGVIALNPLAYELLSRHLTAETVTAYFAPLGVTETRRYELPNLMALNFVLKQVLDGGGSHSLRIDAQGKALGQAILDLPLMISCEEWQQLSPHLHIQDDSLVKVTSPDPRYAIVSLNRPEKRNALNLALVQTLTHTIESLNDTAVHRVIILKGEGALFCSGMDLYDAADPEKGPTLAHALAPLFNALYTSPHVTIAAVHGAVLAGGMGLMATCDLTVAAEGTHFALPETRRGLVAAQVMAVLMRQMAPKFIRELALVGESVDTAWALRTGLINCVVPFEAMLDEAIRLAKAASQGGQAAIAETKEFCDYLYPSPFSSDLERAQACLIRCRQSAEAQEGMAAFMEKRPPHWLHQETQ